MKGKYSPHATQEATIIEVFGRDVEHHLEMNAVAVAHRFDGPKRLEKQPTRTQPKPREKRALKPNNRVLVHTQQLPQAPWSLISLILGHCGHCWRASNDSGKSERTSCTSFIALRCRQCVESSFVPIRPLTASSDEPRKLSLVARQVELNEFTCSTM